MRSIGIGQPNGPRVSLIAHVSQEIANELFVYLPASSFAHGRRVNFTPPRSVSRLDTASATRDFRVGATRAPYVEVVVHANPGGMGIAHALRTLTARSHGWRATFRAD